MQYYLNIEHQVLNDTPPVDACVACRSLSQLVGVCTWHDPGVVRCT